MNGESESVLLDSVILIDHFNGIEAATRFLQQVGSAGCITPITRAEVLTGLEGEAQKAAVRFLNCYTFVTFDREVADLAAELRRTQRWKLPDAFQAAAACHYGLSLATRNTSDFDPQRHSFVVVPYSL